MPGRIYLNFVRTKLTATLTAGATSCTVTVGDGALFASVTGGDYAIGILRHQSGLQDTYREIVKITARSTDTLTITRAQESTSAAQFEVGDYLDIDVTAASFSPFAGMTTGFADLDTMTGVVDGSNAVFTLGNTPAPAASLKLFLNGLLQRPAGVDYTLAGATVTFTAAAKPQTGDNLVAFYRY